MQRNSGADKHSMSEMRSTPESTGNSRPDGKRDRAQRWQSRNDPGGQTKNLKRKNSMKTIRLNQKEQYKGNRDTRRDKGTKSLLKEIIEENTFQAYGKNWTL